MLYSTCLILRRAWRLCVRRGRGQGVGPEKDIVGGYGGVGRFLRNQIHYCIEIADGTPPEAVVVLTRMSERVAFVSRAWKY